MENRTSIIVTFSIHEQLLRDVERFRQLKMLHAGHISRSGVIRLLLAEGLTSMAEGQAERGMTTAMG